MPYLEQIPTALQYLAELIYVNHGKMRPENVGKIDFGKGAYGRLGLSVMDAFHLVNLVSCLEGIYIGTDASDYVKSAVHLKIQEEIHRIEAAMKKQIILPSPDEVKAISG